MTLSIDPLLGSAAASAAAALAWFLRELVRDRRAQTKILSAIGTSLALLEERTRWMVRERRPTPLDPYGRPAEAPEPVDPELTPVEGLRAARDRVRTPGRGASTEYADHRRRR